MDGKFDVRLIPEFDGTASVVEWVEKVELICGLCGVKRIEQVIPIRLAGGAFAVYQQLSQEERADVTRIKGALYKAFGTDPCLAYEKFTARSLHPGETVDVYLAALKKLATLFGGLPERALTYAFLAGLPARVKQLLRASSPIDSVPLDQLLDRARAILKDELTLEGPVVAATQPTPASHAADLHTRTTCFKCNGQGHMAKDCRNRRARVRMRCYRCDGIGHMARDCPGNEDGERTPAPVASPDKM